MNNFIKIQNFHISIETNIAILHALYIFNTDEVQLIKQPSVFQIGLFKNMFYTEENDFKAANVFWFDGALNAVATHGPQEDVQQA